jgi:hypothetical protein
MAGLEESQSIAEIAVALIGFSGLIFVFRARDVTELEARDLSALAMIVGSGGIALTFALLPMPLAYGDVAEATRWTFLSGALGATLFVGVWIFWRVNRNLDRQGHTERTPWRNRSTMASLSVLSLAQWCAAAGWLPAPPIYLFALIVCVLQCLVFVAFMLVIARKLATEKEAPREDPTKTHTRHPRG